MTGNFNTNDRTTWDWTEETGPPPQSWTDDGGYAIHQQDCGSSWTPRGDPHVPPEKSIKTPNSSNRRSRQSGVTVREDDGA